MSLSLFFFLRLLSVLVIVAALAALAAFHTAYQCKGDFFTRRWVRSDSVYNYYEEEDHTKEIVVFVLCGWVCWAILSAYTCSCCVGPAAVFFNNPPSAVRRGCAWTCGLCGCCPTLCESVNKVHDEQQKELEAELAKQNDRIAEVQDAQAVELRKPRK